MPRRFTVREIIRILERDGWRLDRTRGSHRQYVHPSKPGATTVAGASGDGLHPKTERAIFEQAGLNREDFL